MLLIHKNNIAFDNLDNESLSVLSRSPDSAFFEITDGDESLQKSLGAGYGLQDLIKLEPGDRIVSSYLQEADIPFRFKKRRGYYSGEWIYTYTRPRGRQSGHSPVNGSGGAMIQTQIKTSLPQKDLDWLNAQPNKSETVRKAIALLRQTAE